MPLPARLAGRHHDRTRVREFAGRELAPSQDKALANFPAGFIFVRPGRIPQFGDGFLARPGSRTLGAAFGLPPVGVSLRGFLGGRSPGGSGRSVEDAAPPERRGRHGPGTGAQQSGQHVTCDGHLAQSIGQGPLFVPHEACDGGPDDFLGRQSLLQGGRPECRIQRCGRGCIEKRLHKGLPGPQVQVAKERKRRHEETATSTQGRLNRAGHHGGGLRSHRLRNAIQNVTQDLAIMSGGGAYHKSSVSPARTSGSATAPTTWWACPARNGGGSETQRWGC